MSLVDVPDEALPLRNASSMVGGDDVPPTLAWDGWPDAESYAITCYDPDAPTGSGMWHWIMSDLPAATRSLSPEPGGLGGRMFVNDMGAEGYTGAAPPPGPKPTTTSSRSGP